MNNYKKIMLLVFAGLFVNGVRIFCFEDIIDRFQESPRGRLTQERTTELNDSEIERFSREVGSRAEQSQRNYNNIQGDRVVLADAIATGLRDTNYENLSDTRDYMILERVNSLNDDYKNLEQGMDKAIRDFNKKRIR